MSQEQERACWNCRHWDRRAPESWFRGEGLKPCLRWEMKTPGRYLCQMWEATTERP